MSAPALVANTPRDPAAWLAAAPSRPAGVVSEPEGLDLLEAIGIAVPRRIRVRTAAELRERRELPFEGERAVLKVVARTLPHKSDVGGVAVVPAHADALAEAARDMEQRLAAYTPEGFLVCEFVPHERGPGSEFLLGYRHTREFGPVVTLGPGGVHAEFLARALRDGEAFAAFTPGLEREGAVERALARLAAVRLACEPQRGAPPSLPLSALAHVVRRMLAFARQADGSALHELEANPLVVSAGRLVALDALGRTGALPARRPAPRPLARVRTLLEPRSIAIMGVSERANPGRIILENVLREGFDPAAVTVIKPGSEAMLGCRCVPALAALPAPVDLLVLSVSAAQASEAVVEAADTQCAESIVLIPGGLDEQPGAAPLVQRMRAALERARASAWGGPVVNGGNCLGVRSRPGRCDTLFIPEYKLPRPPGEPSPLALITGSGAFAVARSNKFSDLRPVYTITIGNQMDLTAADYLEVLADDPRVDVFALYLEGFQPRDGERCLALARSLRERGKAVLLYLAGRTPAGAAAASSHTASVAGDFAVARALARDAGVQVADTLEEFEDLVRLFTRFSGLRPQGARLGALSNAGFEAVAIADALGPLRLAEWSARTTEAVAAVLERARLSGIVTPRNPMDVTPLLDDAGTAEVFAAIVADPGVDVAVFGCVPLTQALHTLPPGSGHAEDLAAATAIAARLAALRRESRKPFVAVVDAGALYDTFAAALEAAGIPTFRTADRAVRTLARWCGAWLEPA